MLEIFEKLNENWNQLLFLMKEDYEISDHVYNTFIKDVLKPLKLEDNTLYIEVPEVGYISFLENRISDILRILVSHETEIPSDKLKIVFISKNSINDKKEKKEDNLNILLKNAGITDPIGSFEDFVKGDSNSFAYATCISIAENPGEKSSNPVYIYSKTGLGKTHLLHAIAIHALQKNPTLNIRFIPCENFTNEFIESTQNHTMNAFKKKYRNVDILLIDDIHFLEKKYETQEEIFNTFNELHSKKKQIVLTSDRPIRELGEHIEDRLKSRFAWGITCDMQMPNYETKVAILRKKEEKIKPEFPVDNEVIKFIAENVNGNLRELESSLNNVILYSKIINKPVDINLAQERLLDIQIKNKEDKKLTTEKITKIVCDFFNVDMSEVCGKKRNREFVHARNISIFLCREQIKDITLEKIGEFFCGRDHATVINSCKKIESLLRTDKELQENIAEIKERLLI